MIASPEEALSQIRSLRLPKIFEELWVHVIPVELAGNCQRPTRFFELLNDVRERFPRIARALPLWEVNRDAIVAYDIASGDYFRYCYGESHAVPMGDTYQRFVAYFFLDLVDSGLMDELEGLSALFAFTHLTEVLRFARSDDAGDFQEARQQFLQTIID